MEIGYKKRFLKKFKKLEPRVRSAFYERLLLFRANPTNPVLNNHSVERAYPGYRSINVTGNYRALYAQEGERVIFVIIGTHPELYS